MHFIDVSILKILYNSIALHSQKFHLAVLRDATIIVNEVLNKTHVYPHNAFVALTDIVSAIYGVAGRIAPKN